jgi:hypothetical protein
MMMGLPSFESLPVLTVFPDNVFTLTTGSFRTPDCAKHKVQTKIKLSSIPVFLITVNLDIKK